MRSSGQINTNGTKYHEGNTQEGKPQDERLRVTWCSLVVDAFRKNFA
jgi:hypothetical protein